MTARVQSTAGARRDDPRIVKRDLAFLWADVRFAGPTMKHRPDRHVSAASSEARDVIDRIETELAGEATRYRYALYACIAVCIMPVALSGLAWSGLYLLPFSVPWFPFERGMYGLPWLSLFEWVAYLFLALFFVVGFALVAESHGATRRLSADYHRLADADEDDRREFASEVATARRARTERVMRSSGVFSEYVALLDAASEPASVASTPVDPGVSL